MIIDVVYVIHYLMVAHPNVTQKMIGATAVQILVIVELAIFIANVTDVSITGHTGQVF